MAKIENKRTLSKKLDLAGILNMEEADNIIVENANEGDQSFTRLLAEFDGLAVKITVQSVEETPLEPEEK